MCISMYKCYRNGYKCNEGGLLVYVRNDIIQRIGDMTLKSVPLITAMD